jgi:hypothetical protein
MRRVHAGNRAVSIISPTDRVGLLASLTRSGRLARASIAVLIEPRQRLITTFATALPTLYQADHVLNGIPTALRVHNNPQSHVIDPTARVCSASRF